MPGTLTIPCGLAPHAGAHPAFGGGQRIPPDAPGKGRGAGADRVRAGDRAEPAVRLRLEITPGEQGAGTDRRAREADRGVLLAPGGDLRCDAAAGARASGKAPARAGSARCSRCASALTGSCAVVASRKARWTTGAHLRHWEAKPWCRRGRRWPAGRFPATRTGRCWAVRPMRECGRPAQRSACARPRLASMRSCPRLDCFRGRNLPARADGQVAVPG
jgi:hypothetical protein